MAVLDECITVGLDRWVAGRLQQQLGPPGASGETTVSQKSSPHVPGSREAIQLCSP